MTTYLRFGSAGSDVIPLVSRLLNLFAEAGCAPDSLEQMRAHSTMKNVHILSSSQGASVVLGTATLTVPGLQGVSLFRGSVVGP